MQASGWSYTPLKREVCWLHPSNCLRTLRRRFANAIVSPLIARNRWSSEWLSRSSGRKTKGTFSSYLVSRSSAG